MVCWCALYIVLVSSLLPTYFPNSGKRCSLVVHVWAPILQAQESQLAFCGDALGVLVDAMRFKAKEPFLNRMMAELARVLAPLGFELSTIHVWSAQNIFSPRCDMSKHKVFLTFHLS